MASASNTSMLHKDWETEPLDILLNRHTHHHHQYKQAKQFADFIEPMFTKMKQGYVASIGDIAVCLTFKTDGQNISISVCQMEENSYPNSF